MKWDAGNQINGTSFSIRLGGVKSRQTGRSRKLRSWGLSLSRFSQSRVSSIQTQCTGGRGKSWTCRLRRFKNCLRDRLQCCAIAASCGSLDRNYSVIFICFLVERDWFREPCCAANLALADEPKQVEAEIVTGVELPCKSPSRRLYSPANVVRRSPRRALLGWLSGRAKRRSACSRPIRICCGMLADLRWPTRDMTPTPCRRATRISNTQCGTLSWRRAGSNTSGGRDAASQSYARFGSEQCRFVFVFGISVRYTRLLEALVLAIHLIKNALAGQLGRAATFAEPNPCVSSK
jgi:hypothetical protein